MSEKKLKVVFMPGCFDSFEGSQEELDDLIAQITAAAESGELLEQSDELTEDMFAELDPEEQARILEAFADIDDDNDQPSTTRLLH